MKQRYRIVDVGKGILSITLDNLQRVDSDYELSFDVAKGEVQLLKDGFALSKIDLSVLDLQKTQETIYVATELSASMDDTQIFFNPETEIEILIDHLTLADKQQTLFINESEFTVTFKASVSSATNVIAPAGLVLLAGGKAELIRKGNENKFFLQIY